jgi:hypothetical protein
MIGGFESQKGLGNVSLGSRPTQPPIQCVPEALPLGIKRPGREDDYSPPSSAEIKNAWSYTSNLPITPSWRGAQLKHRDSFTFMLSV